MIAKYNRKSLVLGIPGIILQIGSIISLSLLSNKEEGMILASTIAMLIGVVLLSFGLCYCAKAKGYCFALGLLGCLSGLGLLILAVLPEKASPEDQ